jgi:DNA-binding NarL/FixJ family response regulator
MARVALLGFPQDLASQLSRILLAEAHTVDRKHYIQDLKRSRPSVVFICADSPGFLDTVTALKDAEPGLPFVVTTRMPDPAQWLNALEAGAADYCGAPFETVQVRWIMGSISRQQAPQVAAA